MLNRNGRRMQTKLETLGPKFGQTNPGADTKASSKGSSPPKGRLPADVVVEHAGAAEQLQVGAERLVQAERLGDAEAEVRQAAVFALGALGRAAAAPVVLEAVERRLKHPNPYARMAALDGGTGSEAAWQEPFMIWARP